MIDWSLVIAGLITNGTYASAGYLKAREEDGAEFDGKRWLRSVLTGALPPVVVLVLGFYGIEVPGLVAFLGPAVDKLLRTYL